MTIEKRIERFLEELSCLTDIYGIEVTSEFTLPLLHDIRKGQDLCEFGIDCNGQYKTYKNL